MQYWIIAVIALVVIVGGYLIWKEYSKSNGTGGKPGAPGGVQLNAAQGTSCSDWADVLSWTAPSTGTSPITYSWSIDDGSTVVAQGTTADTSVTVGAAAGLAPATTYTAVVTATNQWGSASSDPVSVTTGSAFSITGVSYTYVNDTLLVVAESNTAIPSDVLAVSMSVNGGSEVQATNVYYDQGDALMDYLLTQMDTNNQYVAILKGNSVSAAQINSDWQAFNRSIAYDVYIYDYDSGTNTFNTVFVPAGQPTTEYTASQMTDATSPLSLANWVANDSGVIYMGPQYGLQAAPVGTFTGGELCAGSAACVQPTLGAVFTPVTLDPNDSVVVTVTAGNSSTGVCDTVLPAYIVQGTAPGAPTGVTWQ